MKNLVMKSLAFITMWMTAISVCAEKKETVIGYLKYEIDTETKEATVIENDEYHGIYYPDEITIPESLTFDNEEYAVTCLGAGCFYSYYPNLHLCRITIPPSVTKLGAECFKECEALADITIPPSVTSIGRGCFDGCASLEDITIPPSVTSWEDDCFANCFSLRSIDIPSSVTSLGKGCFSGCSIKSIVIPSSVTKLEAVCFMDCEDLADITIPPSVTSIGWGCFAGCKSLADIAIPPSVTSWEDDCFNQCNSLGSIDIPSTVTSLGRHCFANCVSLQSINIPSSVTSLGEDCFHDCHSLHSMTVDEGNRVYDSREDCNAIIETATNTMVAGCEQTVIPSSVTSLGDWCFAGHELYTIDIPSSVTSLGRGCFYQCPMKSMVIPSSVTSVGAYCFYQCPWLESITIPSSVTSLGEYCLGLCQSLKRMECHISSPEGGSYFAPGDIIDNLYYEYPWTAQTPIQQATLLVPYNSLNLYGKISPWIWFGTITDIEGISGINAPTISGDNEVADTYGIDGSRKSATTTGLNIIRTQDGKAKKVFVK